jgi:predicted secreted hydrolase
MIHEQQLNTLRLIPLCLALLLPADEAPHAVQTEWWYFNIHLNGPGGDRYALHYVIFQIAEPESGRLLYVGQVGFANAQSGSYVTGERVATAAGLPVTPEPRFDLRIGDWSIEGTSGAYRLKADVQGAAFDLELTGKGLVLLHGDDGLVDFGASGVSYYYSRPRLAVSGTLTINSETKPVTGLAWLDKQWGNFQPVSIAWDWASIQLDSGVDLMLTRVVDGEGGPVVLYGTLGRADGSVVSLGDGDFQLEPLPGETWVSAESGDVYPMVWRVRVPAEEIDVTLEPLVPGAEYISAALGVVYWEAGVTVSGTQAGQPVGGQGFVELTGRRP